MIVDSLKLTESGFVVHILAYFVGTVLCYHAFSKCNLLYIKERPEQNGKTVPVWICGCVVFLIGMLLEGAQYFVPYRSFNPLDLIANLCGIALFAILFLVIKARL
jgi:VanZ family protein